MKKSYNWHFWIPKYKIQVVIDETCYAKALKRINNAFPSDKNKFQFGSLILK